MFDDPAIFNHEKTTNEIKECVKDIKVLGRKDLRYILSWRKALHEEFAPNNTESEEIKPTEEPEIPEVQDNTSKEDYDLQAVDQQIAELQEEEHREQKRKKKRVLKEKKKLNERLNLKMILKNDDGPTMEGDDMFSLKQVSDGKKMKKIVDQTPDVLVDSDDDEGLKHVPKYTKYEKGSGHLDSTGTYYKDSDSELEMETDEEDDDDSLKEGLGTYVFNLITKFFIFKNYSNNTNLPMVYV